MQEHAQTYSLFCKSLKKKVFIHLLDPLTAEVKKAFSQLDFWLSFVAFDPRRLTKDQNLLVSYGDDKMEKLLNYYMENITLIFTKGRRSLVCRSFTDKVLAEWAG